MISDPQTLNSASPPNEEDEMARYGISRVSVDDFHCDGFRYTSLADALSQARRSHGDRSASGRSEAEQMADYGVARTSTDYFHIGAFRYTDLQDALAQAERLPTPAGKR